VTLIAPTAPGSFLPVGFVWSKDDVQVVRAGLAYKF